MLCDRGSLQPFSNIWSGLLGFVRTSEVEKYDSENDDEAESGLPSIPHVRLPHQEPLTADGDKSCKPQDHSQSQARNCDAFGLIEPFYFVSGFEEPGSSPPAENRDRRFSKNNDPVENVMECRNVGSSPHPQVIGEGRIHSEDVDDEPVV